MGESNYAAATFPVLVNYMLIIDIIQHVDQEIIDKLPICLNYLELNIYTKNGVTPCGTMCDGGIR